MKTFEEFITPKEKDQPIDLVGFPSGHIIGVTPKEFDRLKKKFDISWDNDVDYEEATPGEWRYDDVDYEKIVDWLYSKRDPIGWTAKKYNV